VIRAGVLAAALALAAPATATPVEGVAASLGADPLFVDPDAADAFTGTETGQLRTRLETATTPVYLAVLPGPESGPSPDPTTGGAPGLAAAIAVAAARPGTYGVVSGTDFRAVSTVIGDRAPELAQTALGAVAAGAETVTALLEFVDQVVVAASQAEGPLPGGPGDDDEETGPLSAPDPWVVAFVAVGGLVVLGMRRRRRG
jgi:hypothetical protein